MNGKFQLGNGLESAEYARGAAHVELHFVHSGWRLQRDAARIERHSLSDENRRSFAARAVVVLEHDKARRLFSARRDRQKRAHFQATALILVQNPSADAAVLARECLRSVTKVR